MLAHGAGAESGLADQDDPAGRGAADSAGEDAEAAALRLERALERIAALAHDAPGSAGSDAEPAALVREVAGRLDALIAQVRSALGTA